MGDSVFIYAAKGNRSTDFYRFSVADSSWLNLRPVPPGPESAGFGNGAQGAFDRQRYVYATRGDSTFEFWRYDVVSDDWQRLPDVMEGGIHQPVWGGSALCFVWAQDTGYVYELRGWSGDFCRFNVISQEWQHQPLAPPGAHHRWPDGSFMVYDGSNSIYAHKSLPSSENWRFRIDSGVWDNVSLAGMPLVSQRGDSIQPGPGACGAWSGGGYMALKGNGTTEFWRYDSAANTWAELETMPTCGSTGHRVWVGPGAAIARAGNGTLYALKGNQTVELWRYYLPGSIQEAPPRRSVPWSVQPFIVRNVLCVPSSPFTAHTSLFDFSGRRVMGLQPGPNDVSALPAGVYFIREHPVASSQHSGRAAGVESGASRVTKVVIQK